MGRSQHLPWMGSATAGTAGSGRGRPSPSLTDPCADASALLGSPAGQWASLSPTICQRLRTRPWARLLARPLGRGAVPDSALAASGDTPQCVRLAYCQMCAACQGL